jgi:hypothetical protein
MALKQTLKQSHCSVRLTLSSLLLLLLLGSSPVSAAEQALELEEEHWKQDFVGGLVHRVRRVEGKCHYIISMKESMNGTKEQDLIY